MLKSIPSTIYTLANTPINFAISSSNVLGTNFAWDGDVNAGYSIERTLTPDVTTSWEIVNDKIRTKFYADTTILDNTTYYCRIKSYNGNNIKTTESNMLNIFIQPIIPDLTSTTHPCSTDAYCDKNPNFLWNTPADKSCFINGY